MANSALGLEITELRLGLPGDDRVAHVAEKATKKRLFLEMSAQPDDENSTSDNGNLQAKNRVVGWPPVCSYRQKNGGVQEEKKKNNGEEATAAAKTYVKVSLDGAPFLRKVGLNGYIGYADLLLAIEKLFGCFKIGCIDVKESENCELVPIYEDKDGDWMLLGDVPWEMFMESCKRLRIMKRSEAKGFGLQSKTPGQHISKVYRLEIHPPTTN